VLDEILAPGFLAQVNGSANYLRQQLGALLSAYPAVFEEVRGQGLLIGLKLRVPNTDFVNAVRAKGLLVVGAGDNVVRVMPPLNIEESHMRDALKILGEAAEDFVNAKKPSSNKTEAA
jgi:acetylornithine/N-succinyldiaminopimelate aminotransferase